MEHDIGDGYHPRAGREAGLSVPPRRRGGVHTLTASRPGTPTWTISAPAPLLLLQPHATSSIRLLNTRPAAAVVARDARRFKAAVLGPGNCGFTPRRRRVLTAQQPYTSRSHVDAALRRSRRTQSLIPFSGRASRSDRRGATPTPDHQIMPITGVRCGLIRSAVVISGTLNANLSRSPAYLHNHRPMGAWSSDRRGYPQRAIARRVHVPKAVDTREKIISAQRILS